MIDLRMNHTLSRTLLAFLCATSVFLGMRAQAQDVVINEIMYHPASHDVREE